MYITALNPNCDYEPGFPNRETEARGCEVTQEPVVEAPPFLVEIGLSIPSPPAVSSPQTPFPDNRFIEIISFLPHRDPHLMLPVFTGGN